MAKYDGLLGQPVLEVEEPDKEDGITIIFKDNRFMFIKVVDGKIETVVGRGYAGFAGDGGPATKAMLKNPSGLAFDSKGNMYISDMGNNRIRKVDTKGIITTFAGTGTFGWGHDGETVEIYVQNFP